MNKNVRDILPVAIAILAVILLVLGYAVFHKSFRLSASEALNAASSSGDYVLTTSAMDTFPAESVVLVNLGKEDAGLIKNTINKVNIAPADLLSAENRKLFSTTQPKILYSEDITKAAQAWTILTQLGYTNVYLLDTATVITLQTKSQAGEAWPLNEQMKYRFNPDTAGRD
jgi:hypothetical protein